MISKCEECAKTIQECRSKDFVTMQYREHNGSDKEPCVIDEFNFCDDECLYKYLRVSHTCRKIE